MKKSLGSLVVFFIFASFSNAEDFEYVLHVDNKTPYTKEIVILEAEFKQTNSNIVLMFDFDLKKSKDYDFTRIKASENDTYHNTKASYRYLVYPLKSGGVEIEFKLTKRVTTDENVAYSFSGDRDNVKGIVTQNTEIKLPALSLGVKRIADDVELVGDFTLSYDMKKQEIYKAYEPIHILLHVEGIGYPTELHNIIPFSDKFKVFKDKSTRKVFRTNSDTKSKTTYPIALSSAKSFQLQKINIKAFNPKTEKSYLLSMPVFDFEVQELKDSELIDSIDMPKSIKNDFYEMKEYLWNIFTYILVFLAGGISSYLWSKKEKIEDEKPQRLKQKIEDTKNERELLQVLLATKDSRFNDMIEKLESSVYAGEDISIKNIKQSCLNV